MKRLLAAAAIVGLAGSGAWAGPSGARWIHIRVDDADHGNGHVDIQVPVAMVTGLLPALKGRVSSGRIHVDGKDLDMDELRTYWAAVREAKDGEYITVRDQDANVRISKKAGQLLLNVDDSPSGSRVRMKVPLPLVDAMLAGGDTIDIQSIGKALETAPSGELLTVDDEDSHVRIWIDMAPAAAREDAQ